MRIDKDKRAAGIIDGDYCLSIASNMLETFQEEELENDGFNSLEMLTIKSVFDDLFENNIKGRYQQGRKEVLNLIDEFQLAEEKGDINKGASVDNIVDIFDYGDRDD